jgi:hypothetical protein
MLSTLPPLATGERTFRIGSFVPNAVVRASSLNALTHVRYSARTGAPNPLRGLVLRHRHHGAGERAVGLSQLIQDREVVGVGDRYQVAWDMPL